MFTLIHYICSIFSNINYYTYTKCSFHFQSNLQIKAERFLSMKLIQPLKLVIERITTKTPLDVYINSTCLFVFFSKITYYIEIVVFIFNRIYKLKR